MLYDITVPLFAKKLGELNQILGKAQAYAEARKFDVENFPKARLFIDQLDFAKQIQIACDTAKLGVSRVTGKDAPVHDDTKTSFADLRTRIQETISYLNTIKSADFNGSAERKITTPRWENKWLTGQDYVLHHAIPNFYFHVTTAYSILRQNGVEIGKKDYLGELPFQK
jgi:uncharacterized protein